MNRKVIVMVGPSNSGKSTWVKSFLETHPNFVRINRDSIRRMLRPVPYLDRVGEELVSHICLDAADNALHVGYDVVLDNTHCRMQTINEVINTFSEIADIEFHVMEELELETLKERALKQGAEDGQPPVSEEVLKRMLDNFRILKKNFDFKPIKKRET